MNPEFSFFPEQASTIASKVDALYGFALAVSAFFSLLIAIAIFFFFIKFRRREKGEVGHQGHGSMALEVVWSIVPLVITMVMFAWGAIIFIEMKTVPTDATEYFATAKQWMWKFQHPEGQREINHLHIPVGEKIKLTMTSEDVIHSFFVPAFRVKQDVLPGRYTTVWFEADRAGEYHLFCTEYCGSHHSQMIGSVTVMEPDDYQTWLASEATVAAPKDLGAQLFEQYICNTCHYDDGSGRGPSLVGILGQEVKFADGTTRMRDEEYLRESILMPAAHVVEGYLQIMPTYQGQLSEVSLLQLISHIKSLSGAAGEEDASPQVVADAGAGANADKTGETPSNVQ